MTHRIPKNGDLDVTEKERQRKFK